jgi:uncharacterized membrane protein affecting hemolysin expression
MPLPVAAWWLSAKTFFMSVKLWACVGVALLIAIYAFQKGKAECQQKAYEALEKELDRQQDKAAEAVKQAVKDTRALNAQKEKGNALVEEARAMDNGSCNLTDSELQHLQRVKAGTAAR